MTVQIQDDRGGILCSGKLPQEKTSQASFPNTEIRSRPGYPPSEGKMADTTFVFIHA